jgi:glyoxylase-like metal-dependent hydrolase (beta-lactamase superfamily II)
LTLRDGRGFLPKTEGEMRVSAVYEIYAIRYATMTPRTPQMNYLQPDPHETAAADLDFFIWLIRGNGRNILVDTGFNEAAAKSRSRKLSVNPVDALSGFGVDPAAIEDVIVTHLHYDHAGNLDRFPNAHFHLQDREMSYATGRCMCNGLLRHPFSADDVTLMVRHVYDERVNFHNGDGEVTDGVTLHRVGGHSDGLQVVRVMTARGPVVLASDAAHYYGNLHRRSPFPIVYNIGDMCDGWTICERLAGHPDRIIPGHDPLVCDIYPRAAGADAYALHLPPSRSFA